MLRTALTAAFAAGFAAASALAQTELLTEEEVVPPAGIEDDDAAMEPGPDDSADDALDELDDPFASDGFDDANAGPSSRPGDYAILRGLDKVTAATRDFTARIGEEVEFGSLTIHVHYCRRRPPEEPPETFVAMEVFDRISAGAGAGALPRTERIFSGWMFASNPAINPLEHAVYDVWPIGCRRDDEPAPTTIARTDPAVAEAEDDAPIEPPVGE